MECAACGKRDWKDWKALLKMAGVRDARVHDARHTLGTYTHVVPELAHEAAERMRAACRNRTDDLLITSQSGRGTQGFMVMQSCRSAASANRDALLGTALNDDEWHTNWHTPAGTTERITRR